MQERFKALLRDEDVAGIGRRPVERSMRLASNSDVYTSCLRMFKGKLCVFFKGVLSVFQLQGLHGLRWTSLFLNMATERSKFQLKNIAESFPKPVIYPCQLNLLQCYPNFVS